MDFIVVTTFDCSGVIVVSVRGPLWGVALGAVQPTTTLCVPGTNSVCSRRTRRCSVPSTEKKWMERCVQTTGKLLCVENEHVYYIYMYIYFNCLLCELTRLTASTVLISVYMHLYVSFKNIS